MNMIMKSGAVLGLAGALAIGAMTPSEARGGRWAAAGVGFAAGALVGAAVASAPYNRGYYYDGGYGYSPGPAYYDAPAYSYGYADSYGYEPAPRYYRYRGGRNNLQQNMGAGGTGTSDY